MKTFHRTFLTFVPAILAIYMPMCSPPEVRPTMPPSQVSIGELWEQPDDIASRDLFYGPWGRDNAPDPNVVYKFVKPKLTGMNPGMTVRDPEGREWSVKQPPNGERTPEGPIEVVMSRTLSGLGYHQPPVYLLPSFTLSDTFGRRTELGGRFRLDHPNLKETGEWSWQQNPFVGTRPYQGLLVMLMMFNSSDLKNENNSLYDITSPSNGVKRWFVVRDLGISLGTTGKVLPDRGDIDAFERAGFITGVENGFVTFDYRGYHAELVRDRITPDDVRWACELVNRLNDRQWRDAFRAGGFDPAISERFIRKLREKIQQGLTIGRS
jgi:hypothetical protein